MCGAFPVDRENPGTKPLKHAVKMLKESDKSMIMFPSGSRHSAEMKGGVAVIAKNGKSPNCTCRLSRAFDDERCFQASKSVNKYWTSN